MKKRKSHHRRPKHNFYKLKAALLQAKSIPFTRSKHNFYTIKGLLLHDEMGKNVRFSLLFRHVFDDLKTSVLPNTLKLKELCKKMKNALFFVLRNPTWT